MPSPSLWLTASEKQIFIVEQHAHPLSSGPALVFSALIPDMDCYYGKAGGRVLPLFRDARASAPNITAGLLEYLARRLGTPVHPHDLIAYLAGVTAHPGFVQHYRKDLMQPGIRIPVTLDASMWKEAIEVGRDVVWLHTFGECFADPGSGRPRRTPRMRSQRPTVRIRIPDTEENMPERISYDEQTQTLHVGAGETAPVASEIWNYDVSGMPVLKHWFGYRRKYPAGKRTSMLDEITMTTWTPAMTTELLELINVLGRCVELEPRQADLLGRIATGPLVTVDDLTAGGILPVSAKDRKIPKPQDAQALFPLD
jgi:hypothetical protein